MSRRNAPGIETAVLTLALAWGAACTSSNSSPRSLSASERPAPALSLVAKIRKADYEGNRAELARLFVQMAAYTEGPDASRARYWRGFAMWRRALNGFNDKADPAELSADLKSAIQEFEKSFTLDSGFTDARIADASCWGNLAYLAAGPERMSGFHRSMDLMDVAKKEAPDNPRLAWVAGATQFYTPARIGGGQEKAIETYRAGLEAARRERVAGALDPSWGEPELLMNLAFSNLNRADPDVTAADRYARAALALVPNWHYIKDILIPQIEAAQKAAGKP
ncbi:MAG: hypothetical protein ABI682_01035 [Acidobacteriota bacterium]